jgi:thiamine biosynthesis lipoprotein
MENKKEKQQDIKKEKKQQPKFDPYAPHKIKWWGWPLLILLIIGTIYIFRNNQPQLGENSKSAQPKWETKEIQHDEGSIFGTFYHITYQSTENLQEGINAVLKQVDQSLSPFNKSSVITAINENTCMNTDSMFTEVFLLAQEVSEATNGAFDITVAPLVNLWGFGF